MKYGSGTVQAEDYFRQTEKYIERIYGNQISEDDLKRGFAREGVGSANGKGEGLIDENYQPQAYELSAGSPFTPKDVSMLGYLAAGVQKVEVNSSYPQWKNFLEAVRKTGGNEVVEQYIMKNLMIDSRGIETDSFFTLEPRLITKSYAKEMTQEHQLVRDAVCNYDLDALADICKRGLDITRSAWNQSGTRTLVNRYTAGYVCGQILDMIDRNEKLAEKMGMAPEDYNYYRGMARVSDMIREGTKAGEMLAEHSQELTPEQKAEYEKAYGRYRNFSIMSSLERKNREESPERQQLTGQMMELTGKPDMQQELRERNVPVGREITVATSLADTASARDSELVSWLGEADEDVQELIFEELHRLAQTAQATGKVSGYDNLKETMVRATISTIDEAEGELHNTGTLENVLDGYFSGAEEHTNLWVNRGDLITVDGKTIHEMMAETYMQDESFDTYYRTHVKQETERIVKEAIKNGKYVEIASVSRDGAIEGELKPLAYPIVPAAPRPENAQMVQDSRERVRLTNRTHMYHIRGNFPADRKLEFIGDWMRENQISDTDAINSSQIGENPRHISVQRNALPSLTVVSLFNKGYSLDQIMDPGQLSDIKQKAGKEVIDQIKNNNFKWLGETVVGGQKKLFDQLDERLKNVDLSDERNFVGPENSDLFYIANCAFDVNQEKNHFKEETLAAAREMDPQNPEKVVDDLDDRANLTALLLKQMGVEMDHKIKLSQMPQRGNAEGETNLLMGDIATAEYMRRMYHKKHMEQPDTPFSRLYTIDNADTVTGYGIYADTTDSYKNFMDVLKNPEFARKFGRGMLSGNLSEKLDMEMISDSEASFGTDRLPAELKEEMRIFASRKDFAQENPKFQGSFQTEMDASIKELDKADPLLLRSSPQYKGMQAQAKNISEAMETIGDPLTYQDVQRLRHASEALTQSVEAYKQHKEIHHSGSKQELKRIAAADKLMQLGRRITESLDKLEQAFETDPKLREQKTAWEAGQKEIAAIAREQDGSALAEEREQQRAQKEAVGKEVIDHMNKRYGKDAPSVCHAAGSMMAARTENGKQKTVSAVEHLGKNIMKYKNDVAIYINGGKSVDKNQRQHLRNTMARMVAMENIVAERVINRYQPGQKTVAPGPQESAYAKDSTTYLKEIMGTKSFRKAMEDMTPEKMKDFVLNDGAVKLVRSMHQEAVEKAQEEKNVSKEKNVNKEMEAPKKSAPVMGQS